jgi:membrane associated rhomboid family serine protease
LTYAFLHEPSIWQHIVFNMLFLWWFGSDVEAVYGTKEFILFYLVSATLGGILFTLFYVSTDQPGFCLGASGAVTAVLVLCACHFPTRQVWVFFLLPVPIWLFVVFQVGQDLLGFWQEASRHGRHPELRSSVAYVVHLAGAGFGFVYYKTQLRLMNFWPDFKAWRRSRSRPRLRVVRPDDELHEVAVAAPPGQPVDEQLEAKVDAVLEKVARSGQESLTDNEREILLKASEIYKRRRH